MALRCAMTAESAFDEGGVTFRYKDHRRDGADRQQVMTLAPTSSFLRAASIVSVTTVCLPSCVSNKEF
jgi:hypothetical protein